MITQRTAPATLKPKKQDRMWILVFVSCFLGLMVDGADLMFLSYSLSSLKEEFQLSDVQLGWLGSITLLGMAIGGIVGGWAADRFGRVKTIAWTILVFSVGTAALGFSQSYLQFAFFRFVSALGLGAEYVVCNTLMAEYVPTKRRTTVLGSLQSGWSVGYVLAAILAGWILPVYGWRWLFYISIIPVILAVLMRRYIPESPSWLESQKLKNTSNTHNKKYQNLFRYLSKDPMQRKMFFLWIITSCFLQFGYFGVSTWLPSYLEKELTLEFKAMSGYLVGTYTAMILGKVIAGWLADFFGRRIIYVTGAISTALFLPVIVYCNSPNNIIYLLVVFGFLYGVPYGVNATYMTESFSTQVRGCAVGSAYNIGRIGAAIAPLTIGYLATGWSIGAGLLVMGLAYFFCGIVPALFIQERVYDPQQCIKS